jgi:DNA-binding LacI/PurR family transcriptional regulator
MPPRLARNKHGSGAITAHDVARVVGVSQSTISRAFTASASIAADTKARVMKAANALGYKPNVIARSLTTRRTHIVAIVMANLSDPFYPMVLDALTERIQARGCQTLLFVPSPGQDVEDILPILLQYQVDAIVITSATVSSKMARTCAVRRTPVVLVNRYVPGLRIHAVSCDNVAAGRMVAEFLTNRGHTRPAFVAGLPEASTNLERRRGYLERLQELGVRSCTEEEGGDYTFDAGFAATERILRRGKQPDAIFYASDVMAFGGMEALRGAGLRIPEDVSIVGFDDVPLCQWPSHGLTTVRQPVQEMAAAAIEMVGLREIPSVRAVPKVKLIPGTMVERSSTMDRGRAVRTRTHLAGR